MVVRPVDVLAGGYRRGVFLQRWAKPVGLAGLLAEVVDRGAQRLAPSRREPPPGAPQLAGPGCSYHAHRYTTRGGPGRRPGPVESPGSQRRQLAHAGPASHPGDRDGGLTAPRLLQPLYRGPTRPSGPVAGTRNLLHVLCGCRVPRPPAVHRQGLRRGRTRPGGQPNPGASDGAAAAAGPGNLRQLRHRVRHVDRRLRDQ